MDETTLYFRLPDGSYSMVTVTGDGGYEPPDGAVQITQAEYEAAVAQIEADNAAAVERAREAERAQARAAYEALLAAGLPEETARYLSGYTPDEDEGPPQ